MAISDCKVMNVPLDAQASQFHLNGEGLGNRSQPDVPTVSADELKDIMDALSTKVLAPAHNKLLDELQILDTSNLVPHLKNLNDPAHPYHVATVIDANTQNGDIPTIGLLVNSFGGGDMSTIDYVTGDPDNVNAVDHALLADDADALGGHADSYFATAQDLSDLSQTVSGIVSPGEYGIGSTITLTDIVCPGVLVDNRKGVRFNIVLDKAIDMTGAKVRVASSRIDIYGDTGAQNTSGTTIYSGAMTLNMYSVTVSKNNVSVKIGPLVSALGKTDKIPVMVVGTFTISVVDSSAPVPN